MHPTAPCAEPQSRPLPRFPSTPEATPPLGPPPQARAAGAWAPAWFMADDRLWQAELTLRPMWQPVLAEPPETVRTPRKSRRRTLWVVAALTLLALGATLAVGLSTLGAPRLQPPAPAPAAAAAQ